MLPLIVCETPVVLDGDSIRCANIGQVRLLGIDAPDRRSSRPCKGGYGDHVCDDRLAGKAKASLREAVRLRPVKVEQVARDRYRRIVGLVSAGGRDLSCWQLRRRVARYIVSYDNDRRVWRQCSVYATGAREKESR